MDVEVRSGVFTTVDGLRNVAGKIVLVGALFRFWRVTVSQIPGLAIMVSTVRLGYWRYCTVPGTPG